MTALETRRPGGCGIARRQRGAVLVVAMILLVVLTLLGVSAMTTTRLEERMASNDQEINRAFQSAESGLSAAFNSDEAWTLTGSPGADVTIPGKVSGLSAQWSSSFIGWSPPPPGSLFSATSFQAAHFDLASVGGSGDNRIQATVHGGAYQIAPKAQ